MRSVLSLVLAVILLVSCTSSTDGLLDIRPTGKSPHFGDNDPHPWTTKPPWTYPVHGIDISKWQGAINWRRTKQAGIEFVYMKATEGGDHVDERFRNNWFGARAAQIPRGAYHFYYFCTTAAKQAEWFIRHVPKEAGALPPVLDMEWNHQSRTCKKRPPANIIRSEMQIFLNRLTQYYGQRPVIYTTVDFYKDNDLQRFTENQFWLRSVADHPSKTYPRQNWAFWQYTGTGRVPGVTGDTDINVFRGSADEWQEWLEGNVR